MSEMIERVARAIATADWRRGIDQYTQPPDKWIEAEDAYDLTNNNGRFHCDQIARAAIEAMRLAPRDVLTAFVDAETSVDDAETRWNAAIDAALREKQDG